jgi:hypothetical protein
MVQILVTPDLTIAQTTDVKVVEVDHQTVHLVTLRDNPTIRRQFIQEHI